MLGTGNIGSQVIIMNSREDWAIPPQAQPDPDQIGFDLQQALDAVVQLRADIPPDAFTARSLGTERQGSAVVIGERGLVLTIGYLITEAETIWLTTNRHTAVPAHALGYDFATGFGLLQALGRLDVPALPLGSAAELDTGAPVIFAAGGGREAALQAHLAGKREFAGYWEYVLDEALFTIPAHPLWGGAALIDEQGRLAGIGSLLIQAETGDNRSTAGNMVVPIDLLPPILEDLQRYGRARRPPRPWLGLYATDSADGIVVAGLAPEGPASRAGVQEADQILEVAGMAVEDLAELWRSVWALGQSGVAVPLALARDGRRIEVVVRSSDRESFLKSPKLH
jgi:S1-C subfamily serine protease